MLTLQGNAQVQGSKGPAQTRLAPEMLEPYTYKWVVKIFPQW